MVKCVGLVTWERWRHVCGFDSVLRHGVQVRRVHVPVIVPPEAVKGDEQQFAALKRPAAYWDRTRQRTNARAAVHNMIQSHIQHKQLSLNQCLTPDCGSRFSCSTCFTYVYRPKFHLVILSAHIFRICLF